MLIVIIVSQALLGACLLAAVFKSTSQAVGFVGKPHLLLAPALSSGVFLLMSGLRESLSRRGVDQGRHMGTSCWKRALTLGPELAHSSSVDPRDPRHAPECD